MDRASMINRLQGCFLALPTLFEKDFSLNLEGMKSHVRFLLANGLREGNATFLVNGAGGEFAVLNVDERKKTAGAVVEAADGRIAIIVGCQTLSTRDAVEIAEHAQAVGAAAVQISPPFYYRHTDDDVYEHIATVAKAAPDVGIVVYNTHWEGYAITPAMLERLVGIPQVSALKWGSPSMFEYQAVLQRFSTRVGVIDNQLLPVFSRMLGARGANLHPALFWPEWGAKLWTLLEDQKWLEAQDEVQRVLLPYYDILSDVAKITGGEGHFDKMGMELVGLPGGRNRPPTRELPPAFKQTMKDFMTRIGAPMDRV